MGFLRSDLGWLLLQSTQRRRPGLEINLAMVKERGGVHGSR